MRGLLIALSGRKIAETFVGNHVPAKDNQQTSCNQKETPHTNYFPIYLSEAFVVVTTFAIGMVVAVIRYWSAFAIVTELANCVLILEPILH